MPLLPIFSLYSLALGVTCITPRIDPAKPLDFDARQIASAINLHKVNYCFGSPTLCAKLAEFCIAHAITIPSLKIVLLAGAPVSAKILQSVQDVLPCGQAFTPYGSTEALPVTFVSASEIGVHSQYKAESGELGVYVGSAVNGVRILVANIDQDRILPCQKGVIGEILVSGANVSRSYLNRIDANKSAKINDGQTLWHRMGDMGYLDDQGRLFFCGRKAHLVVSKLDQELSRRYYSVPVERVFNQHPQVRRSALVEPWSGLAAIVIEPDPAHFPNNDHEALVFADQLRAVAQNDVVSSGINKIFFHRSFPVDARHNAKIFRDQLSTWASKQRYY